jgi:hypothetical protein
MPDPQSVESRDLASRGDEVDEIVRLIGLLRRLERENASLRRQLAAIRFPAS